jgi:tRNA A37 threonylcarbamoyladenosine dehydratase
MDWQERTKRLIGQAAIQKLAQSKIIIFGVGGVGGYVAEALARAGIGGITLVDSDTVNITNLNRQIVALVSSIGKNKVDVMAQRILDINPAVKVETIKKFYLPENSSEFDLTKYHYIVDAVDTVTAKIELIVNAQKHNVPIISCLGAGNKLTPFFKVEDIYKTKNCPLARVLRRELKERGIKNLKTVFSEEIPIQPSSQNEEEQRTPASISYVPAAAGLTAAYAVISDLIGHCIN